MILSQSQAIKFLNNSEVVAIPTETVYGLAAVASDSVAVKKVYQIKNRPADNPLICHFYDFAQVDSEIVKKTSYLEKLVEYFSPGPVSYLVKIKKNSSLTVSTCGLDSMVFRIPSHTVCRSLLKELNQPLAAPSANTSGKYSCTNPSMIESDLGPKIAGILASDKSEIGLESTILDCRKEGQIDILRPGFVGELELKDFLDKTKLDLKINPRGNKKNVTPGSKYRHYAPKIKLELFTDPIEFSNHLKKQTDLSKIAILGGKNSLSKFDKNLIKIDLGKNLNEIAQNLYANFYQLDQLNLVKAFLLLPEINQNSSLAKAIANRVKKATIGK